ncbi:MAG TPA: hypothetical protein VL979_04220 [Solirubrobacteraceae bacterium]|nr:hypothetical protein [Solirubrobacteraceae bacterium]
MTRTALIGLLAAAAAAILPATAMATVAPSMVIAQGNGATAGSTTPIVLKIDFTNSNEDAPKAIQMAFPPGFLLNLGQNEGKCLASSAPSPSCSLGYINSAAADGEQTSWGLYLVAPPAIGDVAGIVLDNGSTTTGGTAPVKLITSPAVELNVEFPDFPTVNAQEIDNLGIVTTEIKLNSPRVPTACGAPLFFDLTTTTFKNKSVSANTPLEVTGCNTLPYAPKLAATVTKVAGGEGADVAITLTQSDPGGESATNGFEFGNPKGVKINNVLAPCFKGTTCTVGTASASSPVLDSSELSSGELTLAGTITSGNLAAQINGAVTMSFPPPFQFSINGPINTSEHTITFLNLPDFPLSTLTYDFLGVPAGPAFVTTCEPSTISATLTPQDGGPPVKVTGPVTNVNCPPPGTTPTAAGSVSGLNSGRPKLRLHAIRGSKEAKLESLAIRPPAGLGFSRKACGGARHRCNRDGLSLSGASVRSARLERGKLVLSFARPATRVSLTMRRPLLSESHALEHKAKKHTTGELVTNLKVTDADGNTTALSLEVI